MQEETCSNHKLPKEWKMSKILENEKCGLISSFVVNEDVFPYQVELAFCGRLSIILVTAKDQTSMLTFIK